MCWVHPCFRQVSNAIQAESCMNTRGTKQKRVDERKKSCQTYGSGMSLLVPSSRRRLPPNSPAARPYHQGSDFDAYRIFHRPRTDDPPRYQRRARAWCARGAQVEERGLTRFTWPTSQSSPGPATSGPFAFLVFRQRLPCSCRLMVRTAELHSDNAGSIPAWSTT